jgi:arsenite-transporting ATPase
LKSRAASEIEVINTIKSTHSDRTFGIPFIAERQLLPALLDQHYDSSRKAEKPTAKPESPPAYN